MSTALPTGWESKIDTQGRTYYLNTNGGQHVTTFVSTLHLQPPSRCLLDPNATLDMSTTAIVLMGLTLAADASGGGPH